MKSLRLFIFLIAYFNTKSSFKAYASKQRQDLECEFPPKDTEDLRHLRRKRLTTETGVVCLEDYPYTVSIRLHDKHWCGGALVATEWVITAAQCFDYTSVDEVTIRLGSVFRDYGGKLLSAVDIVRHPSYKQRLYYPEHNIALVKMNTRVELNNRIRPVALAAGNTELPGYYGETVVTGYGSVTTGIIREGENQELRRMIVKEVPKNICRQKYGIDYYLQHDHMCLQGRERGVALCAGDTGDPAVHFTNVNPAGTLYGIAIFSGTEDCANKSKPGIYAKVSYSIPWIVQVISDKKESGDSEENTIQLQIPESS